MRSPRHSDSFENSQVPYQVRSRAKIGDLIDKTSYDLYRLTDEENEVTEEA